MILRLPDPPLGDGRVVLRPLRGSDVPVVVSACRDPLTQLYTRVPVDYDADDARAFIGGAAGRRMMGETLDLGIAAADDDRLLGVIGLIADRHDEGRAEIGYWVAPPERGRGAATRALMLLSRWAVTDGGLERLDLQAAIDNAASVRAAERCGFVREGTLRDAWYRGPRRRDMALFSLLPADVGRVSA